MMPYSRFLSFCLVLSTQASFACGGADTPFTLSGASFSSIPLMFSEDGSFVFDGDGIKFNLRQKKWCLVPGNDASKEKCFDEGKTLVLSDSKNGNRPVGRITLSNSNQSLIVNSVNVAGQTDLTKPYVRVKNNTSIFSGPGGDTAQSKVDVEGYENAKMIGDAKIDGGLFSVDAAGKMESMSRGVSLTAPKPVEIRAHSIKSNGCSEAKVSNFVPSPQSPASVSPGTRF